MSFPTAGPPAPDTPSEHSAHAHRRPASSTTTTTATTTTTTARAGHPRSPHASCRRVSPAHSDPASERAASPEGATGQMGAEHGGGGHGTLERSSPSASSSQGDVDVDIPEAGPSRASAQPAAAAPPKKKKRTRTLTTPHQSAVLHALLAQSRFPTTAMREEVGRAIGLSARKVQIWFQNQRQKARRPRGEQGAPLTRPPQFGPFTNAPPGSSAGPSTLPGGPPTAGPAGVHGAGYAGADYLAHQHQEPPQAAHYVGSSSMSHLSGPGIPGTRSRAPRGALPLPQDQRAMLGLPARRLPPAPADDSPFAHRFPDEPRTPNVALPPILVDPMRMQMQDVVGPGAGPSSTAASRYPLPLPLLPASPPSPSSSAGPSQSTFPFLPERAPSPFARHPPPPPPLGRGLPPPFTLEPRPQWDDPAFSPFTRPGTAAGAYPPLLPPAPAFAFALPSIGSMIARPGEGLPPVLQQRRLEAPDAPSPPTPPVPAPSPRRGRPDYLRRRERPPRTATPGAREFSDDPPQPSR